MSTQTDSPRRPTSKRARERLLRAGITLVMVSTLAVAAWTGWGPHGGTPDVRATPGGVVPVNPAPSPTEGGAPRPAATISSEPAPAAPTGPTLAENEDVATSQITDAAISAVSGYFFSDSRETATGRATRLSALFTDGADEVHDPPLFTPEPGQESATEATINSVTWADAPTSTHAQVIVAATWSAAWWPNESGGTSTFGGDVTLAVDVIYVNGAWVASALTLNG